MKRMTILLGVAALSLAACKEQPAPGVNVFERWEPSGEPATAGFTPATCGPRKPASPAEIGAVYIYDFSTRDGEPGGEWRERISALIPDGAVAQASFDPIREEGPPHPMNPTIYRFGMLAGSGETLNIEYPDDAAARIAALTPNAEVVLDVKRSVNNRSATGKATVTFLGCGSLTVEDQPTGVHVYDITPFAPDDRTKPVVIEHNRIYVLDDSGWPAVVETRYGLQRLVRRQ